MTSARIAKTAVAQSVLLVEELTARGWTANRHPVNDKDVAQSALLIPPSGALPVKITVVTYPDDAAQLVEFIYEPSRGTGKWSSGDARSYWRMSVFDAPATAIVAAAHVAITGGPGPTFDTAGQEGWETCVNHTAAGHLESTAFVHPTGQVAAVFHYPDTPGECGAWLMFAPSCHADATGHTPARVVRALAESLLVL